MSDTEEHGETTSPGYVTASSGFTSSYATAYGDPDAAGDAEREVSSTERLCQQVPHLVSAFVDALVDFAVSGEFVGPAVPQSVVPFRPFQQTENEMMELTLPPWERKSPPVMTRLSSPERLVAIGDLHGDMMKSKNVLELAGLIDDRGRWIGGKTMLVQVGDVLDRGGEELQILHFMERLKREAARAGGSVHVLQGNHEMMNVQGNMSYAHAASQSELGDWAYWCVKNWLAAVLLA